MKTLKILFLIGSIFFLVGCVFSIINFIFDEMIFKGWLLIPLYSIGIIGNICGLIWNQKKK